MCGREVLIFLVTDDRSGESADKFPESADKSTGSADIFPKSLISLRKPPISSPKRRLSSERIFLWEPAASWLYEIGI